jgi:MoaA/NifB/PqqE/SkfB family radical SAM enzyme
VEKIMIDFTSVLNNLDSEDVAINRINKLNIDTLKGIEISLLNGKQLFDVEVTPNCNIVCKYCPRSHIRNSNLSFMSKNLMENIANWIPEKSDVMLSGLGEALLHKNLEFFIQRLNSTRKGVTMITNGLLLDRTKLINLIDSGLQEIQISLPSINETNYNKIMPGSNFKKVIKNIRNIQKLKDHRIRVRINILKTPDNHGEISQLLTFANELGFTPFVRRVHSRGGEINEGRKVSPINACGIFSRVTFIAWDGAVLSCANDISRYNRLGHVNIDTFKDIVKRKLEIIESDNWYETCQLCNDDYRYIILDKRGVD